ncbi:hypothetical protein ACEPPN_003038 [Leptodophora sp. 'Broadleaf-Isolate-01']
MESDRTRVLRIARNAELVHPDLPLVEAFLNDAVDGERAAKYLLQTYADCSDVNFTRFVKDWRDLVNLFYVETPYSRYLSWAQKKQVARRDDYRCCLTGEQCRFWNLWDVFPIIPPTALCIREHRLYEMLGAFTSSFHRDLLEDQTLENQSRNRWTLSKGAAMFFSSGAIRLENLEGTKYEVLDNHIGGEAPAFYTFRRLCDWKCDLADYSNSGIESPDQELLDIRSRFSRSLMWTDIATKINCRPCLRRSQNTGGSPLKRTIISTLLAIWSKFPSFIRFQTYRLLKTAGSYLYGSHNMGIQRLPFEMYLKYGPQSEAERHAGEFNSLKIVQSQTSIPVPHPIDHLLSRTESFLVTSRIEGGPAGLAVDECSDEEMHRMAEDLRSWIAELRLIKGNKDSKYAITNATRGSCLDYRISGNRVGPFPSEKEFSESLCLGALPGLMHRTDHKIVFTHADLNMRNIIVEDGRITGIVDWENAGFFPEYWEYTKCHFGVRISKRWPKMIDAAFGNKYEAELGIERQYWEYHSGW